MAARSVQQIAAQNRGDPLAQSFMIDEVDGVFVTSSDAFYYSNNIYF